MPSVEHAGASIHYEVHGSGPPLVFVHGAGGNCLSWWQQVPHFARRHSVVTLELRCFGRSSCAPADFHPRFFSGDLVAVLEATGGGPASLVCQSLGGWMGLRAALERPEWVRRLVLAGTPAGLATPQVLKAAAQVGAAVGSEGIRGNAALAPDYPQRRPDMAHLYDQISALNDTFQPQLLARLFDDDVRLVPEALADYRTPTLVLSGDRDQLFPPEALREVAEAIPGAQLRVFAGIGHSIYFEDPQAFNRSVDEFLATHQDAPAPPPRR